MESLEEAVVVNQLGNLIRRSTGDSSLPDPSQVLRQYFSYLNILLHESYVNYKNKVFCMVYFQNVLGIRPKLLRYLQLPWIKGTQYIIINCETCSCFKIFLHIFFYIFFTFSFRIYFRIFLLNFSSHFS